jgi:hypothetical protein
MKRLAAILCATVLLASCSGRTGGNRPAQAQPPTIIATPAALFFAGMDSNRDALVGTIELQQALDDVYAGGDANGDGRLSIIEMSPLLDRWLGSHRTVPSPISFDRNADRAISRAEFGLEFERRFTEFDANADGQLQRTELLSVTRGGFQQRRRRDENLRQLPGQSRSN